MYLVNRPVFLREVFVAAAKEAVELVEPPVVGMKLRLNSHVPFPDGTGVIARVAQHCTQDCLIDVDALSVEFFKTLADVWRVERGPELMRVSP